MKIQLIEEIPVDPKHGLHKGQIYEVLAKKLDPEERLHGVWITGAMGPVKVLEREYRIVKEVQDV